MVVVFTHTSVNYISMRAEIYDAKYQRAGGILAFRRI